MEELILKLKKNNIDIRIVNDNLKIGVPQGFNNDSLIEEIKVCKYQLIRYIKNRKDASDVVVTIPKSTNKGVFPLTYPQLKIFISDALTKDSLVYNLSQAYSINGVLDIGKLEKVFNTLIEKHESLRTSFTINDNDEPEQKVLVDYKFQVERYKSDKNNLNIIINEFIRPFDLSEAPLIRVGVVELDTLSHILLVDLHHIISDGTSQEILIRDFVNLYNDQELSTLEISYGDYAQWYSGIDNQNNINKQKSFWLNEFKGKIPLLNLPTDFSRPREKSYEGGTIKFRIDTNKTKKLYALAQKYDVSLFSLLLSSLSILLSKLNSQEDIVIGTASAGRSHAVLEQLIGIFVNTLPLRLQPCNNLSFVDFLKRTGTKTLSSFDNQGYPYEKLIDDLKIDRDPAFNPLFDVFFVLQNMEKEEASIKGLDITNYQYESRETSKFDLTLYTYENENRLDFVFEYAKDLFKRNTIEDFAEYFKAILDQITDYEDILISDISIISEKKQVELLDLGKGEDEDYFNNFSTLIERFEKQVQLTPDTVAVVFEDKSLTYEELNQRSNQLAYKLKSNDIQKNTIVALLIDKSIEALVSILGILKAGAAFLPIDTKYPEDRINYILGDSGVNTLITTSDFEKEIKNDVVIIQIDKLSLETWDNENLQNINHEDDICYVIYTSGSTGNPKGVMIKNSALMNYIGWASKYYLNNQQVSFPLYTSLAFDLTITSIFIPLISGGEIIIYKEKEETSIIENVLLDNKIDVLKLTPSHLKIINASDRLSEIFKEKRLKRIIVGGEELGYKLAKDVYDKFKGEIEIYNEYGPTETTVGCMIHKFSPEQTSTSVPIGKPISNTSVHILDTNLKPVPRGSIGELYISGNGLAKGYYNNEKLTRNRFIENPFSENSLMYKSGDLVRWLEDGNMIFCGRIDDQVKIRGFRIELGEIEYHLLQHNSIEQVVITVKNIGDNNIQHLCAYVVGKEKVSIKELKNYLEEKIPAYMIPTYFMQIETIPLTPNKKIDFSALPDPDSNIGTKENLFLPQNEQQKGLIKIWSDVLSIKTVGIRDNFFAIGGDSIRAIGIISKINKRFNCSLTVANLHSNQTVEELSIFIDNQKFKDNKALLKNAEEELKVFQKNYIENNDFSDLYEGVYPMNGVEKGMVFHSMKSVSDENVHNVVYHCQNIYPFSSKNFDFDLFKEALNLMIKKHAELRKIFDIKNFAHIIKKEIKPEINYLDVSHMSFSEQKDFITKKMFEQREKRIDLSFSVLWRVIIIKVDKDLQYFLFEMHHSLFDGWSLSSFVTELNNTYINLDLDSTYTLKDLKSAYKNQIVEELASVNQKSGIKYWKRELEGYNRLEFPKTGLPHSYKNDVFNLGRELRSDLEEVALKYNTSFKHICFAAYVYTMKMLTYNNDVTVGMVTNNRPLVQDGEKLLGCFLNTVPFRVKDFEGLTWGRYLEYIEGKLRELKHHERMPFYKVLDIIGETSQDDNPIFDTSFNYIDFKIFDELEHSKQLENEEDFKADFGNFMNNNTLLDLQVIGHNKEFVLTLNYSTSALDQELAYKLSTYFKNVLLQFTKNLEDSLTTNSILLKEEKQYLVNNNQKTKVSYPKNDTIISLFYQKVLEEGDNEAIIFEDNRLTYKELNSRSNQLAHRLRSQGVGRDTIVGLLMNKSIDTVIAMLGTLKAGGCYLPIDVDYPLERIEYILDDSRVDIVVTETQFTKLLNDQSKCILLDEVFEEEKNTSNLESINTPDDLCYIIYTSGTTGKPKGVMVEHRNIVRLFFNTSFPFSFTNQDVWTMFHSHCFDFSVWEMYGALLYGGKLVLVSPSDARDPSKYLKILKSNGVTVLNQTPTAFYSLIEVCEQNNVKLPELRYVIFGGEALNPSKLQLWSRNHPKAKLVNMFGITETTVHVTYKEISANEMGHKASNIGNALPTTSIYLFDKEKNLVPKGIVGEIYVGGLGVTRGYLHKKELTNEKFIINPYDESERLYRSGDLGRLLSNGDIEYLGRIDHQVQLRGFRIELGEIEYHLAQHHSIDNAIVVQRDSDKQDPYLCAYLLGNKEIAVNELRDYLSLKLPSYMIPSYFIQIENIPYTLNNKIAKDELPVPGLDISNSYMAPTNEVENTICEIWAETLGIEKVGITDNYFSLGGDSLKAIGLVFETNKKLKSSITIADLYSNQTIKELANIVLKRTSQENIVLISKAELELFEFQKNYKKSNNWDNSYEEIYPMNGIEQGMVFHSMQRNSDNIHNIIYHEQNIYPILLRDFDFNLFKRALQLMIDKHSELRKIYDIECFAHIIKKEIDPEIYFIDISDLPTNEQEKFIRNKMDEEKIRATELSFSIFWRMNIIKVRNDYQYLLFDFHHSLFDGWSLSSFITELNNTYINLENDINYTPKKLQGSYRDQIIGEIAASNSIANIKYWKEELVGYKRLELPTTGLEHEYKVNYFDLGKELRNDLEEVAEKYNSSFKHLCFAAYLYTMNMFSPNNDVTVGMVTNNRPMVSDGEKVLGCFLNTIPFRAKISKGSTWEEYMKNVEDKLRRLKYHEQMPFYKILEVTGEVSNEENPIFDTSFNFIDFRVFEEIKSRDIQDENINDTDYEFGSYMNDNTLLNVSIFAHNKGFKLVLTYSTSAIDETFLKKIQTYFKNILNQFINHANEKIGNDPIFPKEERQKLLVDFNDTAISYMPDITVLDLFKEQVHLHPNRVAVVFEEEELTYKELDSISNQLSHVLIEKGIVNETLVPICVDRSLEMIIGILGVLKAGGAYVPIDIDYPQSRIDHILEDTEAAIVLTESKYENRFSLPTLILNNTELYKKRSKQLPDVSIENNSLAYVIYTSGTTGIPKGVRNEHSGIYNRLLWMRDYLEVTKEDVIFQKTTFCFDVSVWELLLPLISGAKLLFATPNGHKDIDYLQDKIEQKKVTIMHFVPSMLSIFLSNVKNQKCQSLKSVICSGEELKSSTMMSFKTQLPKVQLYNLYGPTEAAIDVTAINLTQESQVTIGKPIANTQIYIVDSQNNIQPIGVPGELLIGGVQVARGYLKREELNAQKFIDNPFNTEDQYKLYRTGDLSRWLPDGNIEYIGRIDSQVKIRGHRIELGEIEANLDKIKGVEESIVEVREHLEAKQLVAYLKGKELDIESIKTQLSQKLPDYMVPQIYIELANFPLKNNGKIDRKALPAPEFKVNQYTAAKGEIELKLVAIWQEILGVEKIGRNNDFFKLGGQSLKLMRLVSHYHREFGVKLNIQDMFTKRTISTHKELIELYLWQNDNNKEESLETETNIF